MPPERVAQDRNARLTGLVVVGTECPSELWLHAEQVEERGTDGGTVQPDRFPLSGQDRPNARDRGRILQRGGLFLDVIEIRTGHRRAPPVGQMKDPDDLMRILVRQRLQQNGIDDAEDGCVGADPQRQRQQRDDRESGALEQTPNGVADVLTKRVHGFKCFSARCSVLSAMS